VGIEIMESLRGHTSGFAVPTYVIDGPAGGGKIPVAPEYVISRGPGKIVIRNYEGLVTTYTEPEDAYVRDDAQLNRYLEGSAREEGLQKGVSSLASGQNMTIKPEGFDDLHRRGRSGEAEKRGKRNYRDDYS
jgi:lysine 2,3-aminomutase